MDWMIEAILAVCAAALLGVIWLMITARRGEGDLRALALRLDGALRDLDRIDRVLAQELRSSREEQAAGAAALREEIRASLNALASLQKGTLDGVSGQVTRLTQTLGERHDSFARQMSEAQKNAAEKMEALRAQVEGRLETLRQDNAAKLEEMRQTVDEKLQGTLEKRLGESFKLVSERLEMVHKGLGEMQNLASGVGDLKKVLTNVKTRGTWGEIQLGNLLEQLLMPEQFAANVACREGSADRVEYVIRLPGRDRDASEVWLPIDAKFPREDFERLIDAADRGDGEAAEAASKALEIRVRGFAKDVFTKYVNPPRTTDFAILFLPTEGLYAELLRRPGLAEGLQRDFRINLCGPTTLGALLNSLQMGFRTLAIEKRSSEVWEILGAVKTEFGKYGEVLDRVRQKLKEAGDQIDKVDIRKRAIERKLRGVSQAPLTETKAILDLSEAEEP